MAKTARANNFTLVERPILNYDLTCPLHCHYNKLITLHFAYKHTKFPLPSINFVTRQINIDASGAPFKLVAAHSAKLELSALISQDSVQQGQLIAWLKTPR